MRTILFLFTLLQITIAYGDGWDHIRNNDNRTARAEFLAALESDSTDLRALKGLIYLSDLEDDRRSMSKYVLTLLRHHWNEHYYRLLADNINTFDLFSDYFTSTKGKKGPKKIDLAGDYFLSSEELLKRNDLSSELRFQLRYEQAFDKKENRDFEGYHREMNALFNDLTWSYIGPFENINGYGYVMEHPVEKQPFAADASFINDDKMELNWIVPKYTNDYHAIRFQDHLQYSYSGGCYYANTFLNVSESGSHQLRISREYPIVVWIDDELVYTDREYVNFGWDAEIVNITLEAGTHRMLIKYVMGDHHTGIRDSYYDFDDYYEDGYYAPPAPSSEYDEYDISLESLFQGSDLWGGGSVTGLYVRFTDQNGEAVESITGRPEAEEYSRRVHETSVRDKVTVSYFKEQIERDPEDWFNYFMLYSACQDYGNIEEYEEFFVSTLAAHPQSTFFKALTSVVYDRAGKNERSDQTLKGIDLARTPVITMMYKELRQLDPENQEEEYLAQLDKMLSVTPTNYRLITRKLEFFKSNGREEECKAFAEAVMDTFDFYEGRFDDYLESDNKPWDYSIGHDESESLNERKNEWRHSRKLLRNHYYRYAYSGLIRHYKGKEKSEDVLSLYDELIRIEPYEVDIRSQKAAYLFNLERYDEAIAELEEVLTIDRFNASALEMIGDIYRDQENRPKALEFYEKARLLSASSDSYDSDWWGGSGGSDVEEKIIEITGPRKLKNKFNTPTFDEMMIDNIDSLYGHEESVILGYTKDIVYDAYGYSYTYTKMLVKILTESGVKQWIEYPFYYYIGNIENIKVIKTDGAEVFPDEGYGGAVFKNLEPGDIIQVEGGDQSRPATAFGNELVEFNLMNFIQPVHFSKLEVAVPEGKYLGYLHHNLEDNRQLEQRDSMDFYRWQYTNLPKVTEEEASIDQTDPYALILLSTAKDWSPVVEWYQAQTYRKAEADYEIANILDTIIAPGMNEQEKVIAVYNFITKEINYSFSSMLQSGYIPKKTGLTCSSRIGDCKDVATLMITMLRELDIEAFYVLVKSNHYFHLQTLPSTYFDHVITGYRLSDGQVRYLDLTTDFYPWYVLNDIDIGAWALRIIDGETQLFQLPNDMIDPAKTHVTYHIRADLAEDNTLSLDADVTYTGMAGGWMRETIDMTNEDNMNNTLLGIVDNKLYSNMELESYSFANEKEITEPFRATYALSSSNFSENVVDLTLINIPYIKIVGPNTIFSSKKRFNSIDLSEVTSIYPSTQVIEYTFPAGTRLKALPKNIDMENEFVSYHVKFENMPKGIRVTKTQAFKKMYITVAEFDRFRKDYLALVGYDAMRMVLVK